MVRNTKHNKKNIKYRKTMRGGINSDDENSEEHLFEYTEAELITLSQLGFSEVDIEFLESLHMNINLVHQSLNSINHATGANWTPQELIDDLYNIDNDINSNISGIHSPSANSYLSNISQLNESLSNNSLNISGISQESNPNIDDLNNSFNLSNISYNDSLHLSDLNNNSSFLTDIQSNLSDSTNNSNYSNVFDDLDELNYSELNNSNNSNNTTLNNSNNSNNSNLTNGGGKSRKKRVKKHSRKTNRKTNRKTK